MDEKPSTSTPPPSTQSPPMEDILRLLRAKTDSQRLAGLLLVTKFCDKNDHQSILTVYKSIGPTFLHRLLLTGMGRNNNTNNNDDENREAYLSLAVRVLANFTRVNEIATSDEMLAKVPLFLEFMSKEYDESISEECFEFLYLVLSANERGVETFCQAGGLGVLASKMLVLPDGSRVMELAMRLIQLVMSKQHVEKVYVKYPSELSKMVVAIAKQFAVLHNALKFEALHLLNSILSSPYSGSLKSSLESAVSSDWSINIRVGVMDVLQNRVGPAEKLQALSAAECVLSIVGEEWVIAQSQPSDRCVLLILESSRVEIAVILNELAYLKYEAASSSIPNADTILTKLRDLGIAFSLVERIIKLISRLGENEESNLNSVIAESTLVKIVNGLNETVGVVLDYLQDAKDHARKKGDDLIASVRIVGSCLAEAPDACKEKVKELLGYMLSVESEDEFRPFYAVCFLLPMLCQITMSDDGCKIFASAGAFEAVVACLVSLIDSSSSKKDGGGTIFLACDTILNFLLKAEQFRYHFNPCSVMLLKALARWTEDTSDPSVVMMASSICSLILDSTCEEALLRHSDFTSDSLIALSQLMRRSLVSYVKDVMPEDVDSVADLHQIVVSGYSSWMNRFPHIKEVVER